MYLADAEEGAQFIYRCRPVGDSYSETLDGLVEVLAPQSPCENFEEPIRRYRLSEDLERLELPEERLPGFGAG